MPGAGHWPGGLPVSGRVSGAFIQLAVLRVCPAPGPGISLGMGVDRVSLVSRDSQAAGTAGRATTYTNVLLCVERLAGEVRAAL